LIGASVAIPIHYKTFGLLKQDITGFSPKKASVKELHPGDSYKHG
jgi:L-ascorbate metabolism protein UlaG (beta-lactamase superfamily)